MADQPHAAVLAVHAAANALVAHDHHVPSGSFWHRWFDAPHEPHLADQVRAFIATLDLLLDVPPALLTGSDLTAIAGDVERVLRRIEAATDEPGESGADAAAALAQAVYVITTRHEALYQRGATKPA